MESVAAWLDVNAKMIVQAVETNKEIADWQEVWPGKCARTYP